MSLILGGDPSIAIFSLCRGTRCCAGICRPHRFGSAALRWTAHARRVPEHRPIAARVRPGRAQATNQSLNHLIARADWSDAALLAVVRARAMPAIQQRAGMTPPGLMKPFPVEWERPSKVTRRRCSTSRRADPPKRSNGRGYRPERPTPR